MLNVISGIDFVRKLGQSDRIYGLYFCEVIKFIRLYEFFKSQVGYLVDFYFI